MLLCTGKKWTVSARSPHRLLFFNLEQDPVRRSHSYLSYFLYRFGKVPLMATSDPGQKKVPVFSFWRMAVTQIWEGDTTTSHTFRPLKRPLKNHPYVHLELELLSFFTVGLEPLELWVGLHRWGEDAVYSIQKGQRSHMLLNPSGFNQAKWSQVQRILSESRDDWRKSNSLLFQ